MRIIIILVHFVMSYLPARMNQENPCHYDATSRASANVLPGLESIHRKVDATAIESK
jgi:hypothetical protein